MQRQINSAVEEIKEREQKLQNKSNSLDCSLPMDQVDSNHIQVEFIADRVIQRQFEFISALKRSMAMSLCQCSSYISLASQVKQNIAQFNNSAVCEFLVRITSRTDMGVFDDG